MVDLDPVDKKRLQALADTAERTLSAEARLAIRDWIDKQTRGKR
jgi:predicted transcriptional regulator